MDFESIIKRIMELKGLREDQEVASLLGFSKGAFSERKRRGSVPKKELELFCERESININWLLTGEGEMRRKTSTYPNVVGEPMAENTIIPPRLQALIEKLTLIYNEGTFDEQSKLRGAIENIIDDIKARKEEDERKARSFQEKEGERKSA